MKTKFGPWAASPLRKSHSKGLCLVFLNQSKVRMPKTYMRKWLEQFYQFAPKSFQALLSEKELVIVYMDMAKARSVNRQYRQKNYATDILSFPHENLNLGFEENSDAGVLGELIICPQVVKRDAMKTGLATSEYLGYMLIHGVLHLLGYDHEKNARQAKIMFGIQDQAYECLCKFLANAK